MTECPIKGKPFGLSGLLLIGCFFKFKAFQLAGIKIFSAFFWVRKIDFTRL